MPISVSWVLCPLWAPFQTAVPLEPWQDDRYEQAELGSEQDLNCDVVAFQREGLSVIVPVEADADPDREAELRRLCKTSTERVLGVPVPVTALLHAGGVAALEIDWFQPDPSAPPLGAHLGVTTELWGTDGAGAPLLRSVVYALDAAQYRARLDELALQTGAPLTIVPVWTGASVTSLGAAPGWFWVLSPNARFHGLAAAQGPLLVTGAGASFFDGVALAGASWIAPSAWVARSTTVAAVKAPGTGVLEDTLRSAALAAGTYAAGDLELTSSSPDGVWFAEGDVTVTAATARRRWTIASARGDVRFAGGGNEVEPALGSTVAIAFRDDVLLLGKDNRLEGEVHAPAGGLWISGARSTLVGQASARTVTVAAPDVLISDGTHPGGP